MSMAGRDMAAMGILAAVWGASFLFLRVAVPVIGPLPVVAVRVIGAALVLAPLVWWRGDAMQLISAWPTLLLSALLSYVLPFLAFGYAARTLPAGLLSILNASTPLWGALVGWMWAGERLSPRRLAGLLLGFAGVAVLAADRTQFTSAADWTAALLSLSAPLLYALAVHHARRHLSHLAPLSASAGSLTMAGLLLAVPAAVVGPMPLKALPQPLGWGGVSALVWACLAGLALLCTAFAYLLFFRLISRIGPTGALTVTFLVPVFGMLWGALFLGESIHPSMMASTAVIVAGTLLSNGAGWPGRPALGSRGQTAS